MTRVKAIAIAAIATLIFGSVAMGIAANFSSNDTTVVDAVSTAPADTSAPVNDVAQPVDQPVLVELTTGDDVEGQDGQEGYGYDARGGEHEEED
jgi:hypothetical protein